MRRERVRRVLRAAGLVALGLALSLVVIAASIVWWILPVPVPPKARPLPSHIRAALWVESDALQMQLARLYDGIAEDRGLLPPSKPFPRRQLREIGLALWLKHVWTRDEVADAYAAAAWVGGERNGLEQGARHLFGQELDGLPPDRLALLVALLRNPVALDPACHPERATLARNALLGRMGAASLLTSHQVEAASAEPLHVITLCAPRARKL